MTITWIRTEPHPFSAGEVARRAGRLHPDAAPQALDDGDWIRRVTFEPGDECPDCIYSPLLHDPDGSCPPDETTAALRWGGGTDR